MHFLWIPGGGQWLCMDIPSSWYHDHPSVSSHSGRLYCEERAEQYWHLYQPIELQGKLVQPMGAGHTPEPSRPSKLLADCQDVVISDAFIWSAFASKYKWSRFHISETKKLFSSSGHLLQCSSKLSVLFQPKRWLKLNCWLASQSFFSPAWLLPRLNKWALLCQTDCLIGVAGYLWKRCEADECEPQNQIA